MQVCSSVEDLTYAGRRHCGKVEERGPMPMKMIDKSQACRKKNGVFLFSSQESTSLQLCRNELGTLLTTVYLIGTDKRSSRVVFQLDHSLKSSSTALAKSSQTKSGPGVFSPSPPTSLDILSSSPGRYLPVLTRIRRTPRR